MKFQSQVSKKKLPLVHWPLFYNYMLFVNFSGPILQMRAKFFKIFSSILLEFLDNIHCLKYVENHGLRTPTEEIAFTALPKILSHSQIFRYGQSIFCLPHRLNFSGILDLCLHWVSVVRDENQRNCKYSFRNHFIPLFCQLLKNATFLSFCTISSLSGR